MSSPSQWNAGQLNTFQWNAVTGGGSAQGQQQGPPSFIPVLTGQIIPLTNAPNQSLRVTGEIDGSTLTLNLQVNFNEVGGFWVMQIYDQNGNILLSDVPLLTGYWPGANILAPYWWMGIGSLYVINNSGGAGDWPGQNGWGQGGYLLLWDDSPTIG